ncbi:CDP-glycerol glycerophosphotransferase family protein [Schaalia vaccimaxillae]|uniref:CDP-glycerol glycerophosphotransferase family protein n=1 Tax=Schaalia vaccimaxillae TaxID=183916 RepID=UPI000424C054|nr:CDP-glycerol glycerophosphotransferase family protein [Schaalia vaccimaxillae]
MTLERFYITSITWERVNLRFAVERRTVAADPLHPHEQAITALTDELVAPVASAQSDPSSRIVLWRAREASHVLNADSIDSHHWQVRINVTNFEKRRQIPNGTWRLAIRTSNGWAPVLFDVEKADELDDLSRSFLHANNSRVYTVNFSLGDTTPELVIRTYFFARGRGRTPDVITGVRQGLKRHWKRGKRDALLAAYRASLAAHPNRANTILFASEARPSLQGNLRAIRDRMLERGLDKNFEFLYSFRTEAMSDRKTALRLAWLLGSAGTIIIDDYFVLLDSFPVDGNHTIIQAWHAGSGFKDVGYSRFGKAGSPSLRNAHRHYTYAICGSEKLRDVYAEVFGIERDNVIPTGLPRIDDFLNERRIASAKKTFASMFPQALGKRVILFAPTFRGRGMTDAYYDWDRFDFEALYEALGQDSVFLVRQHHFVDAPAPIPSHLRDRIIDAHAYPDTNDLLHNCDVMITDYSSIIYEYSLLGRPMVFYAYDLDMYAATRGMHRDYRATAPGEVATTFDELLDLLAKPTLDAPKTAAFVQDNFDHTDAANADRFIDWLLLDRMPQRYRTDRSPTGEIR